jgi:RNA polymerase sigma-70 factor (ECF subfamily)
MQTPPLPTADALLAQRAWLRRLAGALLRDDAAADDAVQDTMAAALFHRPSADQPLRPWLATVLRNLARTRRRAAGYRQRLGAAIAREPAPPVPSPEEALGRHRLLIAIAAAVEALEEPYRSTVLLCHAEGRSPTEVAAAQGVPPGTVRWRLKRGLDRIRARLDDEAGGRESWALACAGLCDLPPGPGPALAASGGALLAKSSLKGGAVAALVAILAVVVLLGSALLVLGGDPSRRRELGATTDAGASPAGAVPAAAARAAQPGAPGAPPGVVARAAPRVRTRVPRFQPAPAAAADEPPPAGHPRALRRGGDGGLKNRTGRPDSELERFRAETERRLEQATDAAVRCLAAWPEAEPALERGIMLGLSLDPDGLDEVWMEGHEAVPSGPLSCFSEAIYGLDWRGLTERTVTVTFPVRYDEQDAGAP